MKSAFAGLALVALWGSHALGAERAAPVAYDAMIARHAAANGVPEALVRRVVVRESRYNPAAYNRGHYGLMQIKHQTAKAMGYHGGPQGLLDAETNLTYGVRYLAGAYKVARGDHNRAVRFYASGYYYDAKRQGLLAQVGLGRNAKPFPNVAAATPPAPAAAAPTRVIATNAQPVLAAMTPVAAPAQQPTAAPQRPTADSAAVNARIASAGEAVGGFSRVASVDAAAPPAGGQAYTEARALGAPAALVEMRAPTRPTSAAAVPLPPVGRGAPQIALSPTTPAGAKGAPVAPRAPAAVQTAALAQPGVPLPPIRDPSATGSTEPVAKATARPEPRRYRGPK